MFTRQDAERVIFATTDFTENELAEMDLDELELTAEVLCQTDTDVDAEELHSAITNLQD